MSLDQQKLAQAILAKKLLPEKTVTSLVQNATKQGKTLEQALFDRELIPDEKLGEVIAEIYEVPFVKLSEKTIADPLLRTVPYTLAVNQHIIPFEQGKTELHIALNDPKNYELINFIEKKIKLPVKVYYATKKDIKGALKAYNRDVNTKFNTLLKGAMKDPTKIESLKDAAKILDTIILFAFQNNASDIHVEPHKDLLTIRYRIDGILRTITELPIAILELLTTRIKVLANLRTDEHKAAQDGRFKIDLEGNEITLRVSILPIYEGEKTVMRLLSSPNQELDIESMGYSEQNLKIIRSSILKTNGIILVTGPTGSGKTTTLYSILKLLNSPEVNISTIEDPIEYQLEGINQIQVNPKTNLTFADGLKSLLRQDPDILMVGEIRDAETAGIAVNAALTGHLVLATLHTNDVASTLPRLLDMKIEPFLVASTIKMAMAQRLVRTVCTKCKKKYTMSVAQLEAIGEKFSIPMKMQNAMKTILENKNFNLYKGDGCSACTGTGYKGRTTIAEVMAVTDSIKKLIFSKGSPDAIEEMAQKEGMTIMFVDGFKKALAGETTIEEVLRVMRS